MPLSEDEQRILAEIEQQFYREDPQFAEAVGVSPYRRAARRAKWSALGLLASLVFTLFVFSRLWLGLVGFALMLVCALFLYQNLRRMGKAGYDSLTQHVHSRRLGFGDMFGRAGRRMRDRFGDRHRDD